MSWRPHLPFSLYDLKDSLWYRPALMTISALILSLLTVQLDIYLFSHKEIDLPWLFRGGSEGARGVLTAIAGTMITVATTAFSVTLVAMQLGSSQFSPRILRSFTGDPGNQMVLGTFIGTFAYSISVLRTVRSETNDFEGFVPTISVTIALLMTFAAIGSLIFFFHHATRTIQASVVIDRTYTDTYDLISDTYKRQTVSDRRVLISSIDLSERFDRLLTCKAEDSGYLRYIDVKSLISTANSNNVLLELHAGVGEYLNPGVPIVTIWQEGTQTDTDSDSLADIADQVRGSFELGLERTLEYDTLFGLQQLTDISLLALSPSTNDPTTAHTVIDRVGTTLIEVERISGEQVACTDEEGEIRLLYPIPSFETFARLPFDQIRYYGGGDPLIVSHALQTHLQIARQVSPENAGVMRDIAIEFHEGADRSKWVASDSQRVSDAATWALTGLVPPANLL